MMPRPVMPIGYIEESIDGGGTFVLARPTDRGQFSTGTPVLVRNEHQNGNAVALLRGYITETADTTAAFIITHTDIDPHWPAHIDPKGVGNPIYLALQDAFHPDFSRGFATAEEAAYMMECALKHQEDTGIEPRGAVYVPVIVHQDDPHGGPIED